jgi:hypothetical protein
MKLRGCALGFLLLALARAPGAQQGNAATPAQPPQLRLVAPQDPLNPTWVTPPAAPRFIGFPVFPPSLSGYGNYPAGAPGAGAPGTAAQPLRVPRPPAALGQATTLDFVAALRAAGVLPPVAEPDNGWPSWVRTRSKAPLPFAPDKALLIRHSDRVWSRRSDDDPFVPLFFHDKLRGLDVGAAVEVRQAGDFELLLHDSTRVVSRGPSRVRLVALDEGAVELDVSRLTWLRVTGARRAHRVRLPDGSELRFGSKPVEPAAGEPAAGEPAPGELPPLPDDVLLERADEPGWLGGRAALFNGGGADVTWRHATGEVTLAPGERVWLFLTAPARLLGPELAASDTELASDGPRRIAAPKTAAVVRWSGARFQVAAGSRLVLDPLQGDPFVPAPPPVAR